MRRLVPQVTCDRCSGDMPPDVPSVRITVTLPDEDLAYAGENCESCAAELREIIANAVVEFLREEKVKGSKKKAVAAAPAQKSVYQHASQHHSSRMPGGVPEKDRTCPICPTVGRKPYTAPTRSALGQHLSSQHGTTFGKLGMLLPAGRPRPAKSSVA